MGKVTEYLIGLIQKQVDGRDVFMTFIMRNVSAEKLTELRGQLEARLRPVLRERDFEDFNLERAFGIVADMAKVTL